MKHLFFGGVALLALAVAGPAGAADMPVKAPVYKAPPPVVVYNWTGFYIGGNLGWAREHVAGTSDFIDTGTAGGSNPQSNSFSSSRFIGGVQAGYNWQIAPSWLLGFEGDWDWLRTNYAFCRQTDSGSSACTVNGRGFETISAQAKWLATARGRLGVIFGSFLFYGTGGFAWGRIDTTLTQNCLINGCGAGSALRLLASSTTSQTKSGWTAGLGIEGMLYGNWSAKAEWLHIDLGSLNNSLTSVGNNGGVQTTVWNRSERFDEFRLGLNYRFGDFGKGPMVARY